MQDSTTVGTNAGSSAPLASMLLSALPVPSPTAATCTAGCSAASHPSRNTVAASGDVMVTQSNRVSRSTSGRRSLLRMHALTQLVLEQARSDVMHAARQGTCPDRL